jgi:hypothetical protein
MWFVLCVIGAFGFLALIARGVGTAVNVEGLVGTIDDLESLRFRDR